MSDQTFNSKEFQHLTENDLESEVTILRNQNVVLNKQLEDYKQQEYELKRQLTTAKAMQEHLLAELESVQNEEINKQLKAVSSLEEELANAKQDKQQMFVTIQQYESEIQKQQAELMNVVQQQKCEIKPTVNDEEIFKYTEEISDLKAQVERLATCISESKVEMESDIKEKETKINELTNELREIKACLDVNREKLNEEKNLVQNLKEELNELKIEYESLKNVSHKKATKGNSLFAEVDDYRVKLQNQLTLVNKKYAALKMKFCNQSQVFNKLRLGHAAQKNFQEEHVNEATKDVSELKESYKNHYNVLTKSVECLEKELIFQKNTFSELLSGDKKCTQQLFSVTRKDIAELQKNLNAESLSRALTHEMLFDTKKELRKWHSEALHYRQEVLILKQEIEQLKVQSNSAEDCPKSQPDNYWQLTYADTEVKKGPTEHSKITMEKIKPQIDYNKVGDGETKPNTDSMEPAQKKKLDNYYRFTVDDTTTKKNSSDRIFSFSAVEDWNFDESYTDSILKERPSLNECKEKLSQERQILKMKRDKENVPQTEVSENRAAKTSTVSFAPNIHEPEMNHRFGRKTMKLIPICIPSAKKT